MNTDGARDLNIWWWLGVPVAMLLLTFHAHLTSPELMALLTHRDEHSAGAGIAEGATVLILLPGIAAGITVLLRRRITFFLSSYLLSLRYRLRQEAPPT